MANDNNGNARTHRLSVAGRRGNLEQALCALGRSAMKAIVAGKLNHILSHVGLAVGISLDDETLHAWLTDGVQLLDQSEHGQ